MQQIELTVRQLNLYVRSLLEGDVNLSSLTLVGELSNFKNHYSSGHWYFALKDSAASVRGVMFSANAKRVDFIPQDGMLVVCKGYVSLYEKDGQFQFYAETMRPFGKGDLAAEFERVKALLEAEGLFLSERKRPIKSFPKKIGVVTSKEGAALQDVLQITARRYPLCEIVVFPCLVQGTGAPKSIINALNKAYNFDNIDTIIVCRGGGSAEDLSCFNDEALARFIVKSPVPVISAVGHETDFTICDFVADLRAPTPSAAAELVVPSLDEIMDKVNFYKKRNLQLVNKFIDFYDKRISALLDRRCYKRPELLFSPFELRLDRATDKLQSGYLLKLKNNEAAFKTLCSKLMALSPQNTINRGFSVTYKDGKLIKTAQNLSVGDKINIKLKDGCIDCTVDLVTK